MSPLARLRARFAVCLGVMVMAAMTATAARALVVELKDVAPDRIERQRAALAGNLPLAETPDITKLDERLAAKGFTIGNPVFIRIFKAESELELWMFKDGRYEHFATYPICHWSGTLGPKLVEGDKQAPEGFYTVGPRQMRRAGHWPRALNIGFPNALDRSLSRTGSYILIHGGCSSVGCFAMTDPVIDEIYRLSAEALKTQQDLISVHVYPFRMTAENMARNETSQWAEFWRDLKVAYDSFERTRLPPRVSVCDRRYLVTDATRPEEVADGRPLACGGDWFAATEPSAPTARRPGSSPTQPRAIRQASSPAASRDEPNPLPPDTTPPQSVRSTGRASARLRLPPAAGPTRRARISCVPTLPSCRRWIALHSGKAARKTIAHKPAPRRSRTAARR
jgi:murein L,D-transpeptidase YafK